MIYTLRGALSCRAATQSLPPLNLRGFARVSPAAVPLSGGPADAPAGLEPHFSLPEGRLIRDEKINPKEQTCSVSPKIQIIVLH